MQNIYKVALRVEPLNIAGYILTIRRSIEAGIRAIYISTSLVI